MIGAMSEPPPAPPHPPHAPGGHGAHGARGRRLVREPDDRKIAGVCAGLADHMGIDVTVVRLGAVLLALITPLALVAYLVASVVLPERRADEPRVRARKVHLGNVPHPIIVVAAIVAVVALVDDAWWLDPFPAAVALIGVGVWLIVQDRDEAAGEPRADAVPADSGGVVTTPQHFDAEGDAGTTFVGNSYDTDPTTAAGSDTTTGPSGESTPPASPWWSGGAAEPPAPTAPPAEPRATRSRLGAVVLAVLLVGAGAAWLADSLDMAAVSWTDVLALGLVVVGLGLVVAAWRGRAYGLVAVACVLAAVIVVGDGLDVPLDAGTGERTVVVDSRSEVGRRHELFAGQLTVDLTGAPLATIRPTRVEAAVGMGELVVLVPVDATVEVDAEVAIGEVTSERGGSADQSGVGVDESFTLDGGAGAPRLELDLSVGFGHAEVRREVGAGRG